MRTLLEVVLVNPDNYLLSPCYGGTTVGDSLKGEKGNVEYCTDCIGCSQLKLSLVRGLPVHGNSDFRHNDLVPRMLGKVPNRSGLPSECSLPA